jgi:hypothetical protein
MRLCVGLLCRRAHPQGGGLDETLAMRINRLQHEVAELAAAVEGGKACSAAILRHFHLSAT